MEKIFKRLDILLKLLLILSVVSVLSVCILLFVNRAEQIIPFVDSSSVGTFVTVLLIVSFSISVLYFILGVIFFVVYNFRKNINNKIEFATKMFVKGIVGIVISLFLFFILSVAVSFTSGSTGSILMLPRMPDDNYPVTGFPKTDLEVSAKQVDKCFNRYCYCEVTIKNNNSTLTAVNVALNQTNGLMHDFATMGQTVPPHSSLPIKIVVDKHNACNGYSIDDAGVLK